MGMLEIKWLKWKISGTGLSCAQCQYCEKLLLVTKSEILQIKMSSFLILAFTCTYGWDFCWGFFLISLNLSILSPDVILAAKLHFFFLLVRLLSRRKVKMPRLKKTTNYLFQMVWQYKNALNWTLAFSCGNI